MDENGLNSQREGASRRGLVIALVALVVVIALGLFGYSMLAGTADRPSVESPSGIASTTDTSAEASRSLPQLSSYDATLHTESGDARTLVQIADGKPLIMNFWATWCPYCVQEMGDFQELYNTYGDRISFAFIDVADGRRETVSDAAAWLRDNGYTLPAYYDTTGEASAIYGATSLPTTAIVDANGTILNVSPGMIDSANMRRILDALLEG